jgi:predicted enzyme related to lactoylglutathione lyase
MFGLQEEEMSNADDWYVGEILWQDLSVKNAIEIRDFYRKIIGWDCIPEDMGGYDDFHMVIPPSGCSVAGICHARGDNADIPPVWLIYIAVENVEKSAQLCEELGGEIVVEPRLMGKGRFCVIRDPAGAVCALYRPPA